MAPNIAPATGPVREYHSALSTILQGRDTRWYKGRLGRLNFMLFFLFLTMTNNGYDGSMMNGLQTIDTWKNYFHNPQGGTLGVFNAIQTIGGLSSLLLSPYLCDWVGRRRALVFGTIIMLIATGIQTAAQNVGMFIGCRFLIGFGLSFAGLAAPLLIGELAFPTHRGPITSLWGPAWNSGAIIAAWTTFGSFRINNTWAWRLPSLIQGVPGVITLCVIYFIPESPRWLVSKGRDEEALAVITKWHCNDDAADPLATFEYEEIMEALRVEREAKQSSSYLELFKTPGNRRRMRIIIAFGFFSQWSGTGLISYYLTLVLDGIGITSTGHQTLINGILQVWGFIISIIGATLVDKAGRRPLVLTSLAGMLVFFVCWTICSAVYTESTALKNTMGVAIHPNLNAGHAVLALIILFNASYAIGISPVQNLYSIEICPTNIRARAITMGSLSINIALIFNQYVNPLAMKALNWKYYIVYDCWLLFELVFMYMYFIETKGPNGPLPLEETVFLYDGEDSAAALEKRGQLAATGDVEFGSPAGEQEKAQIVEMVEDKAPTTQHLS